MNSELRIILNKYLQNWFLFRNHKFRNKDHFNIKLLLPGSQAGKLTGCQDFISKKPLMFYCNPQVRQMFMRGMCGSILLYFCVILIPFPFAKDQCHVCNVKCKNTTHEILRTYSSTSERIFILRSIFRKLSIFVYVLPKMILVKASKSGIVIDELVSLHRWVNV